MWWHHIVQAIFVFFTVTNPQFKKKKKEIPILHKNVLDEAAEVVNVITSLPLCLLNNLNNEMGSTHKALL